MLPIERQAGAAAPSEKPNVCAVAGTASGQRSRHENFERDAAPIAPQPSHAGPAIGANGNRSLWLPIAKAAARAFSGAMLSTRSTTARCTPPGGMRENARNSRSEYGVSRKPRIARVSSEPTSVAPKKNDTGTSSASATRTSRPGADAVHALFVFLHLLECDAEQIAELGLRHALGHAPRADALADLDIVRSRAFGLGFRSPSPAMSP